MRSSRAFALGVLVGALVLGASSAYLAPEIEPDEALLREIAALEAEVSTLGHIADDATQDWRSCEIDLRELAAGAR